MRVAIIGRADFGEAVLRRLLEDGVTVAGVAAPEPTSSGRRDPLWSASEENEIPRVSTTTLKEPDGIAQWKEFEVDFCLRVGLPRRSHYRVPLPVTPRLVTPAFSTAPGMGHGGFARLRLHAHAEERDQQQSELDQERNDPEPEPPQGHSASA